MTKIITPPGDNSPLETRLPATEETHLASSGQSSGSAWLSSSGGIDHGRFPPGTLLGGRYRIVGRLGKGGMGEVFRADDLRIGQQVALKFLAPEVDRDPALLTQLHTEVRMARQVSHPNVCRVYDIDEVDGHTFLSMEYVDGEDLASLLRRIGRFPEERGLAITRQICAGLAAAHERGVVHRDFKPANVMIDGTGKVRITDFGLAGLAGESLRAGTPAYMAPEQLAGGEVTARSDIYALGLVLYELFTGKRALEGANLAELIHKREQSGITPPTVLVRDLNLDIERGIQRCLKADPAERFASALALSASLPGGDPLAAALAAGETPSPEMVAAAGKDSVLRPGVGIALLAFTFAGLVAVGALAGRSLLVNRIPFTKTADVLEERAREIIALARHSETPGDTARGVALNMEYVEWAQSAGQPALTWDALGDGSAPLLDFWYRTSPQTLTPMAPSWTPQWNDPPLATSGMVTVVVDDRGRLVEFVSMPPQHDASAAAVAPVDWHPLFQAAGLQAAQFAEVPPQWTPRVYAEQRLAWEGPMPQRPDVKLRVEAGSYRGRPVAFKVVGPWTRPALMEQAKPSAAQRASSVIGTLVVLTLLAGAVLLVRANLKSGRADRRGAGRIALFLLSTWSVSWALGARHSYDVDEETSRFFMFLAFALLNVGFTWLFYLALEPFVRRLSPDMLIGWTRLLVGQVRDPRVGRDVLIGVATGVLFLLVAHADTLLPAMAGASPQPPRTSNMSYFVGARYAISLMVRMLPNALQSAMLGAFFYVVLLAMVRRQWIAATLVLVFVCATFLAEASGQSIWLSLILAASLGVVAVIVFLRFGLLAFASALYVSQVLTTVPLTIDLSRPHAGISALAMLFVAALAIYAFYISRAGEGMLRRLLPAA
ncbi:MAG TPA: serine/threonine-protein kinase [Vicinamibacterales bacterium]|nr:serine/threonine-protein kinase [Vicinamibacterales bacterium]